MFCFWRLVVLLWTCGSLGLAGADESTPKAKVATPSSSSTLTIISPEPEEILIAGSARALVRTARGVKRIEATLNGADVSAAFRAVRRGVWTARFPRRLLRPGSNYLTVSADDALGRHTTELARFFLGTRRLDFLSIKAGKPRRGSVPVSVQTVSDPKLLFKATLNGRDITSVFQPRVGANRAVRLGVDEGLHQGQNLLRVIAARRDGTFAHRKRVIEIGETQPLVGAGPLMSTTGGLPVRLKGSYLPGSTGSARPKFRWEVISAPNGSAASLERSTRRGTLFKPDKVGTYKLRLSVGAAYDETEVQNIYNAPPIGVPVDMQVISGGDVGIQVGPSYFPLDAANNSIQIVVLDPNTLETLYQGAFLGTAGDAQTVLGTFTNPKIIPLNSYPLVLLSEPYISGDGVNAAWSQVIQAIGGQPLPGMQLENGGFSLIGVLGGAAGTAWENPGSNFGNPPPGDIQGYLQQDNQKRFTFVPNRVPYNLAASEAAASQNTIQVGANSWSSNNVSCGTGAFQVVTLGAENLSPATYQDTAPVNQTFVTNGCGPDADTAGVNAMIQYLNAVTQITGNGNLLVLIQSIGNTPLDPSMSPATLQQLNAAIVGVGGTDSVMGNGSYSLVGRALLPFADLPNGFELAEASSALTGETAQLSGTLKFSRVGVFQPQLSNGTGVPSAALSTLAYQAPQPDLNSPGEIAALAYIANNVLRLPLPSSASCYIPANNQPDVRSEYCNSDLHDAWAVYRTTLSNTAFPAGQSFTQQDWNTVMTRLAPPSSNGSDYQGEFQAVNDLWSLVATIKSTNNS